MIHSDEKMTFLSVRKILALSRSQAFFPLGLAPYMIDRPVVHVLMMRDLKSILREYVCIRNRISPYYISLGEKRLSNKFLSRVSYAESIFR